MDLEYRIGRLEKSLRRWRRVAFLCVVSLIAIAAIGAAQAMQKVRTDDLMVFDRAGNPYIVAGTFGGMPGLAIGAVKDKTAGFSVVLSNGNPTAFLYDSHGVQALAMQTTPTHGLTLRGNDGKPRVIIFEDENGAGHISLYNKAGKKTWEQAAP